MIKDVCMVPSCEEPGPIVFTVPDWKVEEPWRVGPWTLLGQQVNVGDKLYFCRVHGRQVYDGTIAT